MPGELAPGSGAPTESEGVMIEQSGQGFQPIGQVKERERVAVRGIIVSTVPMALRGCPACRCVLADATGELDLMFLGRIEVPGMEPGRRCVAEGTAAARDYRMVLWNPRYQLEES